MVWKLCDKEERPKFKRFIKLLFVLCAAGLMCWNTTKEFCMGKHEGFHTALWRPVLAELE